MNAHLMLSLLGETELEQSVIAKVHGMLKSFDLFAFVLHDKIEHRQFDLKFEEIYHDLHRETNKHVLFFSFVNPKVGWDDYLKNTAYFSELLSTDFYKFLSVMETYFSHDSVCSVNQIARALRIDSEQLPVIILTQDFSLQSFKVIETNENIFVSQFKAIEKAVKDFEVERHHYSNEQGQERLFKDIDKYLALLKSDSLDYNSEVVGFSVANALQPLFRIIRMIWDCPFEQLSHVDKQKIIEIFESMRIDLERMKVLFLKSEEENIINEYEQMCKQLSDCLALVDKPVQQIVPEEFADVSRFMERNSHEWFISGLRISKYLETGINRNTNKNTIDYSPAAICIGKSFENEINLSIYQWLRKIAGVNLPDYYDKPQPNLGVEETQFQLPYGNTYQINVNRSSKNNQKLIYPGLGTIYHFVKDDYCPDQFTENDWRSFLQEWETIFRVRNQAAHTKTVNKSEFNKLVRSFERIIVPRLYSQIVAMKKTLRGET